MAAAQAGQSSRCDRSSTDALRHGSTGATAIMNSSAMPIGTVSGKLIDLTKPDEPAVSVFTNSAGRFAAINLRPGHHYRVALYSGASFEFTVPEKSDALLDLKQISPEGRE